jgi:hypothetical protein
MYCKMGFIHREGLVVVHSLCFETNCWVFRTALKTIDILFQSKNHVLYVFVKIALSSDGSHPFDFGETEN